MTPFALRACATLLLFAALSGLTACVSVSSDGDKTKVGSPVTDMFSEEKWEQTRNQSPPN
jgi:hypothetical protein